ncbi:hypothetical protein TKK_0019109 [Trichogramma kaykai]
MYKPKYAESFHLIGSVYVEPPIPVSLLQEFDRRIAPLIGVHLRHKLPAEWKKVEGYVALELHRLLKAETSEFSIPKRSYNVNTFRMIRQVDKEQDDNKVTQEVDSNFAMLMGDSLFGVKYEMKLSCCYHKLTEYPGEPNYIPRPHYELRKALMKVHQKYAQYIKDQAFDVVFADHAIKKVLQFIPKLFGEVFNGNRTMPTIPPARQVRRVLTQKRRRLQIE